MAEVAYTRKYRPKSMNDYMGASIKTLVFNRFKDEKNYPQVILLYGTRGTGKTTLARLLSKEYLCIDKVDGHACGKCQMCQMLDEELIETEAGASVTGVTEVNIATDGGKADIQELLDDCNTSPMYPLKYKIYILHECHMLTKQAQNALLKQIEEPQPWTIFILATTDPDDLLGTVKDRCQLKIEMKSASVDDLVDRMLYICQQEGIKTSIEALKLIAKKCNRNPRESIMMLENMAKNYSYTCTVENILKDTGSVATEVYMEYYRAVNKGLEEILTFTHSLKERNIDPRSFIKGLTEFTLSCINIKYAIGIDDYTVDYIKQVKEFFNVYTTEDLDTLLQIIEYANRQINDNDTMGELVINTTAMRIGKIKLLSVGLQHEQERAAVENKNGNKKSIEILKKEEKDTSVIPTKLDSSLMLAAFGSNVKEVKAGVKVGITEEDEKEEDNKMMGDADLFELFKI